MAKIVSTRVVAFNVPQTEHEVVRVQVDLVPHFYDQLHQHPEIQIMLIDSGEGTVIAGDYVGRFQSGDVFVVGSGQPHVFRSDQIYYKNNSREISKSISLYFSEKYFGKELWSSNELSTVREFVANCQHGYQITAPGLKVTVDSITKLCNCKGLDKLVGFFSLLKSLSETIHKKNLSIQPSRLQVSEESRMNSILEFTFRESHRKIYVTEVARLANLSVEAFCRYFKIHTRKTCLVANLLNTDVFSICQLFYLLCLKIYDCCFVLFIAS